MTTRHGEAAGYGAPTEAARLRAEDACNRRPIEASLDPPVTVGPDGHVPGPVDLTRMPAVVRRNLAVVDHQRQAGRHRLEQRKLLEELRAAVAQIGTLSGLLPFCANGKKVRDDQGYWTRMEQYDSEHANVSFTDGRCPHCIRSLYPDLASDLAERP